MKRQIRFLYGYSFQELIRLFAFSFLENRRFFSICEELPLVASAKAKNLVVFCKRLTAAIRARL